MLKYAIILPLLLLSGCGCKYPHVPVVDAKKPGDWRLSCSQLTYAMNDAEYQILSTERKYDIFEYYSPSPFCIVDSYSNVVKSSEAAKDRLAYLNMIYNSKNCGEKNVGVSLPENDEYVKIPTK